MNNSYPVVFFVFKRPATTLKFLELMRDSGINKIYIFADGPRNEIEKFETDIVKENVVKFSKSNPKIKVISYYSKSNVGLKKNIINGLNRVFNIEGAAIIIEDDCLPNPDFFRFMSEMLAKYKDEQKIMSVNGTSPGGIFKHSYDFTKYPQCWGWATWARAWKLYDPTLNNFNQKTWKILGQKLGLSRSLRWYWGTMLTLVKSGWINTWDYQWSFAHFYHCSLAIAPSVNLVQNIGFDSVATHTKFKTKVSKMQTGILEHPLSHPLVIKEALPISHKIETSFYANPVAFLGLIRQYIYWMWS